MVPQIQEIVMTGQIPFDAPVGALLSLTLLVLLASGVLFESGLLGIVRTWLSGGSDKLPGRVATAGHRG